MNILYTAFNGKYNSSKILLDNIDALDENKVYLKNSFITSIKQLENKIKSNTYDYIISFGQASLQQDSIKIEVVGRRENTFYKTDFDYLKIKQRLEENGYEVEISDDAGSYYCNNLYYYGLKYIRQYRLKCRMIFIHIPLVNKVSNIVKLANLFDNFLNWEYR